MTRYSLPYDAPTALHNPGLRATLAAQDRDLIGEARDLDACIDAAVEATCALYPPILLGLTTIPTIQN